MQLSISTQAYLLKFENGEIKILEKIYENSRTIRPPTKEECPYDQYEFSSLAELQEYLKRARNETLDSFYLRAKLIAGTFNDQDDVIIIGVASDSVWSYYQDLFSTTHYV